jgi:formylglycine-generating enzyme required for sulfatase activity
MKRLLAVWGVLGAMGFAQVAEAWRPSGWVYHDHPWAYDATSGDWYWFNGADVQWVANMGNGQWSLLEKSALTSGWTYYNWAFAYAQGNGAWHWINEADVQWVVNMRTSAWSRFGTQTAPPQGGLIRLEGDMAFGDVPVGLVATRTLTIYNDGAGALAVDSIGYPSGFGGAWSGTIGAGSSQEVAVAFSPTMAVGYGGTIAVHSDKTGGTNTIVCSGTGLVGAAGDYLIVDLAGGPSATSYPVSYAATPPTDGGIDAYKTTKLVLRRIPAGAFSMGSPTNELGRGDDETQHSVTLTKDFYIGVFEVTQKQWERVTGDWPSYFNNAAYSDSRPVEQRSWDDVRGGTWPGGGPGAGTFMQRISARTGLAFDLPTEAQWEYACRAGTTTALNSGKNLTDTTNCPNMAEVGRYWHNGGSTSNQGGDTSGGTAKVGSYQPNAWGLYDMHGNVWEWCLDWYETYPGDESDPSGAASGSYRVSRGGGWSSSAGGCRSANRFSGRPGSRYIYFGFRVSMTLP